MACLPMFPAVCCQGGCPRAEAQEKEGNATRMITLSIKSKSTTVRCQPYSSLRIRLSWSRSVGKNGLKFLVNISFTATGSTRVRLWLWKVVQPVMETLCFPKLLCVFNSCIHNKQDEWWLFVFCWYLWLWWRSHHILWPVYSRCTRGYVSSLSTVWCHLSVGHI